MDNSNPRHAARKMHGLREERLARAHERIAARLALGEIRADSITRARAQVAKWRTQRLCSKWYVQRWEAILRGPARTIAARLLALEPADARALFQNTPFGFLVRAELEAGFRKTIFENDGQERTRGVMVAKGVRVGRPRATKKS